MKSPKKSLSLLIIIIILSTILFAFYLCPLNRPSENPTNFDITKSKIQNVPDVESDQSFSTASGSAIEYNVYVANKGKTTATYLLTALSNAGYNVEVWLETDQIGSGDEKLLPSQDSSITLEAGKTATLVVKVSIPSDATESTMENLIIEARNIDSSLSDSVILSTTVNSNLPYPSNWIQLGSDHTFPTPTPARTDIKAVYYTNNGTDVFFRIAAGSEPDPRSFLYSIYLDTIPGGQQIDNYNYDYLLSSDGICYVWDGVNWVDSGFSTYWKVDGTGIVLWSELVNFNIDEQDIHFLASTTTKSWIPKDKLGHFTILKSNISEMPFILIPILSIFICVCLIILRKSEKRAH